MAAMEAAADAALAAASRAFCGPAAVFIQIQGCLICLTLGLGWAVAAFVRKKEIRRMRRRIVDGNSFAFLCDDVNELEHSVQEKLPRVSVIMPLKGFGEHNLQNWRTQITSLYGGALEFLFVVESKDDPAYHAVSRLIAEYKDKLEAKVVVAGLSTTCSQKIHNQLIGVDKMHKDSKYVLFLDDDVRLHPGTIGALTKEMEKNPEIFIQTGYPLDLPSGSLGSYCIYEYHMPCSIGFATGGKTFFLWGGCMMMHADDFRQDLYGVVSGLRDGGYSDDMTLAAIAGQHKRLISSPPVAVFPHPLASDLSFSRYWNYLRKQTFVLESYVSKVNWMMNRALFASHCYLSWGFVWPYIMALVHVLVALRAPYSEIVKDASNSSCELVSMWNLTKVEIQLCNMLSPEGPKVSLGSYNWGLVFIAVLVDNFLYPISAFRSHFSQSINWSGIRYHLKDGKISKIERENKLKYTDLGGKHLYGKRTYPSKTSLFGYLSRTLAQWHQPKKYDV
uniref:ceramide glucosyltransferase n=1 Tax=Oryza meridionalis TaxID=40149 RepID=A0A0E0CBT5_9ORYZ